ncbi:MAG: V-type ATP synthase subunit E family protein [Candidatus Nanohaloarchaea archaeon]|nr:V-type ATP synthase subunit E family protein [Candidatus Nanohaloarchaea archaeon]
MSLDKVKQELLQQAEEEAEQIKQDALQRGREIREEAEQEAERIKEQAKEEAEQEAASLRKKKVASANMEAKKIKQQAKQKVIDRAFERLEERVTGMDQEQHLELVEQALDAVRDEIEIGRVEVTPAVADDLDIDATIDENSDIQGVVIHSDDGSIRYDHTFSTMLENVRNNRRKELVQQLF